MTVADERTPLLPSLASTSTSATASTATTPLVTPLEGEDDLQAVTAIPDSKRHTAVTEAGGDVVHERPRPLKESMSRPRFVLILAGLWASNFAFAFQSTAIPTLAPTISSGFAHAELAAYLGAAYTLGNTAGIPVYGVLVQSLGRRFAMLAACALFASGTAACALARDIWTLIAARALTGLGGGGLISVSAVVCTDLVHLRERGFYQGIMMTIFGLGATIGGPLSGALADAYGWRAAFWVQLPAVTWCASVVGTFLPEPPHGTPSHASVWAGLRALDWRGIGLLLGSVSALISGLSLHASFFRPWCDPAVVGLLLASVVGAIAFVGVEANAELPIVPLSMFKSAQLVYIWLASMFLAMSSSAFLFHVPMFFAVMRDEPASSAGVVVSICSGIGASTGTLFAGHHIRRGGKYTVLGVTSLVPPLLAAIAAAQWTPTWPQWAYYATVLASNIGYAVFLCVSLIALISSVDSATMPRGTSLLYTVRSLGSTIGVSLGGSVQVGALVGALNSRFAGIPGAPAIVEAIVHSKGVIRTLPPEQQVLALDAYAISLSSVWYACAGVAVLTLLSAMGIRQNAIPHKDQRETRRNGVEEER